MSGGYQQQGYSQPAIGVQGEITTNNPRAYFNAGPGGLVAGTGGVTIGRFAWVYPPDDPNGSYTAVSNTSLAPGGSPTIKPAGIVQNTTQGQNSTFLSNAGMNILQGFQMALQTWGDQLVVNDGTVVPIPNYSKAFAVLATGKIQFANPGTIIGGASATGSSIASQSSTFTGSIADDVLTITTAPSNPVYPGAVLSGTGIATATTVISQLTGTAGAAGTYLVSIGQQTVASTAVTAVIGVLTIGTATGTFVVGDVLTGTGVVAGTQITANITGSGGSSGTMAVSNNTVVSSTTITASTAIETDWVAASSAPAAGLVKITRWQP